MSTTERFDYKTAFARNIGWITPQEQLVLRSKRVAIAGLGGVGGSHLLTLARLGIGAFTLADFDSFELANFNRQAGAFTSTIGRPKLKTLTKMAREINPQLDIREFPQGINDSNTEDFLFGASLFIDGLDFFAIKPRRKVFSACSALDIPAITAAPLGMGVALLNFLSQKMSFEAYFQMSGYDEKEQLLRFLVGLSPAMLQRGYLVEPNAVDFSNQRGPSTPMACELCAGVAATQALKILLKRGKVLSAPHGLQFDAYRNKMVHTWRPGGNNHPVQRLAIVVARRLVSATQEGQPELVSSPKSTLEMILDLARWAPSGDNAQPWRFEVIDKTHLVVHGSDTREHCIYDLQGHASQLSLGALLENIKIAATAHNLNIEIQRRENINETTPTFDVRFQGDEQIVCDPLNAYIAERTVQRRAMRLRKLSSKQRVAMESALPEGYRVLWVEGLKARSKAARLAFFNGGLRLTLPEAYTTHKNVIDWENPTFSSDRIPAHAVGLDRMTLHLTRWAMQSWNRIAFMNRYLGGTLLPRIQLDLIPGLFCSGYFILLADQRPQTVDDFVSAGGVMQRFWLTATSLGLYIQPVMTPLIFQEYVLDDVAFSDDPIMRDRAKIVADRLQQLTGNQNSNQGIFMGRIGSGSPPPARSTRLPLGELIRA
ncbi:MAG: thiamine biosynthesis protein ThiF [Thiothrix sp.]|nr:MAG: thiamine biosynthesis protein ThiF [Thiothrix sp.]